MLDIDLTYKLYKTIAINLSQSFKYTIEPNTKSILLDFKIENLKIAI
jgi:hypothetical protein